MQKQARTERAVEMGLIKMVKICARHLPLLSKHLFFVFDVSFSLTCVWKSRTVAVSRAKASRPAGRSVSERTVCCSCDA